MGFLGSLRQEKQRLLIARFNGREDNLGDLLIHWCLWNECRKYSEFIAYGPDPAFPTYSVTRFRHVLLEAVRARIKGRPIFLMGPPGARVTRHLEHSKGSLKKTGERILLRLLNPRKVLVGISIEENYPLEAMRNHAWIGVRDDRSLRLMHQEGLTQTRNCPDLAFLLKPRIQEFSRGERALLSFRARIPEDGFSYQYEQRLRELVPRLPVLLRNSGLNSEFCFQVDEDRAFCSELRALTRRSVPVDFREARPTLEQLASVFEGVGLVLSNRLHVLLEAAAFGCLPVLCTSVRHNKVRALFSSIGWDHLSLDIADTAKCESQLLNLFESRRSLREKVNADFLRLRKAVETSIEEMLTI